MTEESGLQAEGGAGEGVPLKLFSFFSGAGFLDLGFEKAGFEVVFASELCDPFADAYVYARERMGLPLPKRGLIRGDAAAWRDDPALAAKLADMVQEERSGGALVGFVGGPPCPDFSVAGKNRGAEGERGMLSQVYVDLICAAKPDFFLFENVKGLWRTKKHRAFFDAVMAQAEAAGYGVSSRLVNAIEYGAPQDRDRILAFGVLQKLLGGEGMESFDWTAFPGWRSLAEIKALPWPDKEPFEADSERPKPDGIPEELTVECWFRRNGVLEHPNADDVFTPRAGLPKMLSIMEGDVSKKCYKRLHRWRYSPTAAYGNNEVHLHPYHARRISAAEALAVQSLPKEYVLPPAMPLSAKFKTIGNGVPFVLAHAAACLIRGFLLRTYPAGRNRQKQMASINETSSF